MINEYLNFHKFHVQVAYLEKKGARNVKFFFNVSKAKKSLDRWFIDIIISSEILKEIMEIIYGYLCFHID